MRHPSRLPCAFVLGFALLCQGGALGQSAPEAVPAPELPPPELPAPKAATPDQATPEEQRPDPPALVGRVARLDGTILPRHGFKMEALEQKVGAGVGPADPLPPLTDSQ